jgi:ribosome biogenesis GTPase
MTRTALVVRSTGSWYDVVDAASQERMAVRAAGKLRLKGDRATNPIAVGDRVEVDEKGAIVSIHPRKNVIQRKSVNLSHAHHTLASNLDAAFLVVTVVQPETSTGFIDRFLVAAEAFGVPTTLVLNKQDAWSVQDRMRAEELTAIYRSVGYAVLWTSAVTGEGMAELKSALAEGGVSLLSGHSGVGKSTLINALVPGAEARVGDVSQAHGKGQHTTTYAELHPLPTGGYLVDSPGIKGFGLVDIDRNTLHHLFPEFFRLLPDCKFHNCLHVNEPGCAVRFELLCGYIQVSRYESYLAMLAATMNLVKKR